MQVCEKDKTDVELDYKAEFFRLFSAAEQVTNAPNLRAPMSILRGAVEYYNSIKVWEKC